mmetsp:Transcript_44948/g.96903  ORF Transcript_44948/g.96903 Transcript_44948/m.96903 type:complete len:111 (-) Transcript_44948:24-356(-)
MSLLQHINIPMASPWSWHKSSSFVAMVRFSFASLGLALATAGCSDTFSRRLDFDRGQLCLFLLILALLSSASRCSPPPAYASKRVVLLARLPSGKLPCGRPGDPFLKKLC